MTPSIRTYLLINLLLSMTLITSLAIIGNLFLAHQDIQTQLDADLIRSSLRIEAFFSGQTSEARLKLIQKRLNASAQLATIFKNPQSGEMKVLRDAKHSTVFQIWNQQTI